MEKLDEEPHGVPWRAKENRRILQDNHHQLIPRLLSSQETVVRFFCVVLGAMLKVGINQSSQTAPYASSKGQFDSTG